VDCKEPYCGSVEAQSGFWGSAQAGPDLSSSQAIIFQIVASSFYKNGAKNVCQAPKPPNSNKTSHIPLAF
jgi:hypothetical protein